MINKKLNTDGLPKKENQILWNKSEGYTIYGEYGSIDLEIKIIKYNSSKEIDIELNGKPFTVSYKKLTSLQMGKELGSIKQQDDYNIGDNIVDIKRDINILDCIRIKGTTYYKYSCNKCRWTEGLISKGNLSKGVGCGCCSNKVAVLGINTIWDTDRWMCDLGVSEEDAKKYTRRSSQKIDVKCPNCGEEKSISIVDVNKSRSIRCICGKGFSYGHKYIYYMLKQLNIIFRQNYTPYWCKFTYKDRVSKGEYDFFINDIKLIIEVDGGLHRNISRFGDENENIKKLKDRISCDNLKDTIASNNGYTVIRIPYYDDKIMKPNILKSEISDYINLENIDWNKCDEFCLDSFSFYKEIWHYINNNLGSTVEEISNNTPYNTWTIRKAMEKGFELNKINCTKKEYEKIRKQRVSKKCEKAVALQVDGKDMGIFNCANDVISYIKDNYDIDVDFRSVSDVARGYRKLLYKKFKFYYV